MATVKTLALFLLVGAALGLLVVSLIAPGIIKWDNTVRTAGAMCPCAECAGNGVSQLLVVQGEGSVAGAVVFLGLGIAWEVRKRKQQQQPSAPAAT